MGCGCGSRTVYEERPKVQEKKKPYTILNVLKDELTGKAKKVPKVVHNERMEICMSCQKLFKPTKQCTKCGCFVEAKTFYAKSFCPIGKWPEHI